MTRKPQAVSNQLQRLSDLGILAHRRDGKSIFYRGGPLRHQIMRPKGELARQLRARAWKDNLGASGRAGIRIDLGSV